MSVLDGAFLLFAIGLYGLLVSRHLLKVLIVLQILVKAALLAIMAASGDQVGLGQSLAVNILVADTIALVIGLALAVQLHAHHGTLDMPSLR